MIVIIIIRPLGHPKYSKLQGRQSTPLPMYIRPYYPTITSEIQDKMWRLYTNTNLEKDHHRFTRG